MKRPRRLYDLFQKVLRPKFTKGRSADSLLAAAHYIFLRLHNEPVKLKEVARLYRQSPKTVKRTCNYLVRELDIYLPKLDLFRIFERLCDDLGITKSDIERALPLFEDKRLKHLSTGRDLWAMAGAIIYWSTRRTRPKLTQVLIAQAAGCTEVTIRKRWKELREVFGSFDEWLWDQSIR